MEIPATLTDMKELHNELRQASTELWDLCRFGKMSDTGHELAHDLLFDERQKVYDAASRKVATTAEDLAAQLDIFIREAGDDPIFINPERNYHGQMMRSIRAGVSGLAANQDAPALKAVQAG